MRRALRARASAAKRRFVDATAPIEPWVDAEHYFAQLTQLGIPLPTPSRAAKHYRAIGWRLGLDPSREFSTVGYLRANPDVIAADMNPLVHYVVYGRALGRSAPRHQPSGYLTWMQDAASDVDADFYRTQTSDLAGLSAGLHYVAFGWRSGLVPSASAAPLEPRWPVLYLQLVSTGAELVGTSWADKRMRHVLGISTVRYPTDLEPKISAPIEDAVASILSHLDASSRGIVGSFAFDDFDTVVGGTQLCLGMERRDLRSHGYDYVFLYPVGSRPRLAPPGSDPQLAIKVNESDLVERVRTSQAGELLARIATESGKPLVGVAVHGLLGHEPVRLVESLAEHVDTPLDFWAHDFFTACASPMLMRNGIDHCGAPALDSGACRRCNSGQIRPDHVERMRRFVTHPSVRVSTPSEFARTMLLEVAPEAFQGKDISVIPHGELRQRSAPASRPSREGPLRIAFVGQPAMHKGWLEFLELRRLLADDPRVELWHVGSPGSGGRRHVRVEQRAGNWGATEQALRDNGIDAVLFLSRIPETYSLVTHELLSAGCVIVTWPMSGNAHVVATQSDRALFVSDEHELFDAASDGSLVDRLLALVEREAPEVEFCWTGLMGARLT